MKPFADNGGLTPDARTFNYWLSRARIVIENAFGRLKGRWRCLLKRTDMDLKNIPNVIARCVILHNICETHKEQFTECLDTHDDNWTTIERTAGSFHVITDPSADDIRNVLKAQLTSIVVHSKTH